MTLPSHQADTRHSLLRVSWLDVSALPLDPGAPTTAQDDLARASAENYLDAYASTIEDWRGKLPTATFTIDPALPEKVKATARTVAQARLDTYEKDLRAVLAKDPTEDDLADWLANRAITDATRWGRFDATDARWDATKDFFHQNNDLKRGRFQILPEEAAEPRCEAIAGNIYPTFDEAQAALDDASHYNCVHWVEAVIGKAADPTLLYYQRRSPLYLPDQPATFPVDEMPIPREVLDWENSVRFIPYEHLAVFSADGTKMIYVTTGQHHSIEVPFEELQQELVGSILTHNHPLGLEKDHQDVGYEGHSLSDADIMVACQARVALVRSVTPTSRYTMQAPAHTGWDRSYWDEVFAPVYHRVRAEVTAHVDAHKDDEFLQVAFFHLCWTRVCEILGLHYSRVYD